MSDQRCRICKKAGEKNEHANCHVCPDMSNGDIMPGCIGGAVYGDIERCTCDGSGNPMDVEERLAKLEFQMKNIMATMAEMDGKNGK